MVFNLKIYTNPIFIHSEHKIDCFAQYQMLIIRVNKKNIGDKLQWNVILSDNVKYLNLWLSHNKYNNNEIYFDSFNDLLKYLNMLKKDIKVAKRNFISHCDDVKGVCDKIIEIFND